MRDFKPGDMVQIKPAVTVGRTLIGGRLCTVREVVRSGRNTGLMLTDRDTTLILVSATQVTYLRHEVAS